MHFKLATIVAVLSATALAAPSKPSTNPSTPDQDLCPSEINSLPACCRTDVGGVAALDCQTNVPNGSRDDFRDFCDAVSKTPLCCITTLLGIGVSCVDPPQ